MRHVRAISSAGAILGVFLLLPIHSSAQESFDWPNRGESNTDPLSLPAMRTRTHSMAPPGSTQVNVDSGGMNILGDAANEPSLAIDPTNPLRIAIGWRQFDDVASSFRQAGYGYSADGGASWTFPGVLEPYVFRSDPVLAADSAGRFFYYSLLVDTYCGDLWRSLDGGATWPTNVPAFGGDKPWIAIDRTGGMGEGNIYCVWQPATTCSSNPGLQFIRSTDHGATWSTPVGIPRGPYFGAVAVGPDGAVYVAGTNPASSIIVAKSTNAQNPGVVPTWIFSVTGNFLGGSQVFGGPNPGGLLGQIWIAADPNAAARVYLLASVIRGGSIDVMFSRSTNGGQTWSPPIRINDDTPGTGAYHWFGTMSVAPNGRIDAIWNDTRDSLDDYYLSRIYYSASTDRGVTWSANYALTPAWDSSTGWPVQTKIGDYYHMISDDAGADLAYAATFNGEQDVYFMRIPANDCNRNGVPDDQDIAGGASHDCNGNALPDECERDCNHNGYFDDCDLASGRSTDCDSNGVPDECDPGGAEDCNRNGQSDLCDVLNGNSTDCNANMVPDECEPFDVCPPEPNPTGFSILPRPISTTQITMQAMEVVDVRSPPVQYFFEWMPVVAPAGHSSGWQSSRDYTDGGLLANYAYFYRVIARDSAIPTPNSGFPSQQTLASTAIETPSGITFGPITTTSIVVRATGTLSNLGNGMSALYFEVSPAGGIGAGQWVASRSATVTGLSAGRIYRFRVKARNIQGFETAFSPQANARTTPTFAVQP